MLGAGLIVGLILGFGFGARVGSVTPGTTPSRDVGTIADDVAPDAVSQRLRDAYYASGGRIVVCAADATIECAWTRPGQSTRLFSRITLVIDPAEIRDLTPVAISSGRTIVAGDFGPIDGAAVTQIVDGSGVDGRLLTVVNPNRAGIDYVDLGLLGSGTYLIAIAVPWRGVSSALILLAVQ